MNRFRKALCTGCIALLCAVAPPAFADSAAEQYNRAVDAYAHGRYRQAAEQFARAAEDGDESLATDALFWGAQAYNSSGDLSAAQRGFDRFLDRASDDHPHRPEAVYQLARTSYLDADYQTALRRFDSFIETFPDSQFVANALYWSGESLMALGRPQEARMLFGSVVSEYPNSFRFEAARYRLELIDLSRREQELLDLLRYSAEEQLRLSGELQAERRAHRETGERLAAEREAGRAVDDPVDPEVEALRDELERRIEAVRLQQDALRLMESYIDWFDEPEE